MENWIFQIRDIIDEAAGMKTLVLERRNGEPVPYQAGQFLTLLFSFRGHDVRRSYSFSTAPAVDAYPAITVKRVANGEISRHLLDHLRVGGVLTALPPAGRFTLADRDGSTPSGQEGRELVFIAAGSGVVPVFSLLKAARAAQPGARLRVLTQQHDEASSPFRGPMAEMGLEWTENLTMREGRLTKDRLEEWARDAGVVGGDALVFLCAPFDFMRMTQIVLRTMGVADDRIRREHFTTGPLPPAPPVFDATPKKVLVRGPVDLEFVVTWPESILTAAIRQGIPLPYSCRAGRCSSCVAHRLRGHVRMTHNEVLTDKDLAEGLVLTCVGYAETDVELGYARSSATNAMGSRDAD
jgi:ring-1,2-phenylacetyl-CoA epoxidase subunit PaaE